MKKILLLSIPFMLLVSFGCSKSAEGDSTSQSSPAEVAGKEGNKTKGVSADQVGLTDAGQNADKTTGSALGGK